MTWTGGWLTRRPALRCHSQQSLRWAPSAAAAGNLGSGWHFLL